MPKVLSMGLAVSGEATVKGQSACLMEYCRGGLENDEVSTVYSTSFSAGDAGRGLHHATKPKVLTLVNGEEDVVATGHGQVKIEAGPRCWYKSQLGSQEGLDGRTWKPEEIQAIQISCITLHCLNPYALSKDYCYRHYVMGQFDPLEEVLTDYAYGFPKRFHEVWNADTQLDEGQACEDSIAFLRECHEFMAKLKNAFPNPGRHHPDGYAADFGKAVLGGVADFIADHPKLNRRIKETLEFTDTHYMRIANAIMRACQQLEAMAPCSTQQAGNRVAWNVWESAHALHNVFRLWEFQLGHAGAMYENPDDAPSVPELSPEFWLQRAMLVCLKWKGGTSISTAALREALKYDMKRKRVQDPSKAILRAADGLVEAGLVEHAGRAERGACQCRGLFARCCRSWRR